MHEYIMNAVHAFDADGGAKGQQRTASDFLPVRFLLLNAKMKSNNIIFLLKNK